MALGDDLDLHAEGLSNGRRQESRPVVVALAATNHDLTAAPVDVLHAEGERLQEAEAAALKKLGDQAKRRVEVFEQRRDLPPREDGREVMRPARPLQPVEIRDGQLEDAAVQEDDRAEGLVQGGRRDLTFDREMIEKCDDLGAPSHAGGGLVTYQRWPAGSCVVSEKRNGTRVARPAGGRIGN